MARFLFLPHAPLGTLAHLTSCLGVALELDRRGHETLFAYGGDRPELIDRAGVAWRRTPEARGPMSDEWFSSQADLDRVLDAHAELIEQFDPCVCVTSAGAGRLSVAISGRPHLAIQHALGNTSFGRAGRRREAILGDLRRPARAWKDLRLELRNRRRPPTVTGRIWHEAWSKRVGVRLDSTTKWTGTADLVACTTTPLLDPTRGLPGDWRYVGPISYGWGPVDAPAADVEGRPRAYVTQGSTGAAELLEQAVGELAAAGFAVVASGGALSDPRDLERLGERVHAADLHDTRAELRAADVAVIAGGHMTAMEALIAGTPTVVLARLVSQALSAKRAERLGTGIGVWPRVPRGSVARAARRCMRDGYRSRAAEVAAELRAWDGAAGAADLAEGLAA
jgi:UDP:flavonoid glycosyltransferase YjiC (YdhE family)